MSMRRKLGVVALGLLTLAAVFLTYVEWLVAGIGSAMDVGEPTEPLGGYAGVVAGVLVALALAATTVLTAARGRRSGPLRTSAVW